MSKRRVGAGTVSLNQVLARYWELANLDPEMTKGSVMGQLKALDALCAELSAAEGTPKAIHPAGVYRAAWMAEPEPEN